VYHNDTKIYFKTFFTSVLFFFALFLNKWYYFIDIILYKYFMRSEINLIKWINQKSNKLSRFSLCLKKIKGSVVEKVDKIILMGSNWKNTSREIWWRDLNFSILDEMKEINWEKLEELKETEIDESIDYSWDIKISSDLRDNLWEEKQKVKNPRNNIFKKFKANLKDRNKKVRIEKEENNSEIITRLVGDISEMISTIDRNNKEIDKKLKEMPHIQKDLEDYDNYLIEEKGNIWLYVKNLFSIFSNKSKLNNSNIKVLWLLDFLKIKAEFQEPISYFEELKNKWLNLKGSIVELKLTSSDMDKIINAQNKLFKLLKDIENRYASENSKQTITIKKQVDQIKIIKDKNIELFNNQELLNTESEKLKEHDNSNYNLIKQKIEQILDELDILEEIISKDEKIIQDKRKIESKQEEIFNRQNKLLKEIWKIVSKFQKEKLKQESIKKDEEVEEEIKEIEKQINDLVEDFSNFKIDTLIKILKDEREWIFSYYNRHIIEKFIKIVTERKDKLFKKIEIKKQENERYKIRKQEIDMWDEYDDSKQKDIKKQENGMWNEYDNLNFKYELLEKTFTILNIIVNPSLKTNAKIINILQFLNNFNT